MENTHELLDGRVRLIQANALSIPLPDKSVHCCVTSPPYWGLRDYGTASWTGGDSDCDHSRTTSLKTSASTIQGSNANANHAKEGWTSGVCGKCGATREDDQLGLEKTPEEFVQKMVEVFREVKRVLRDDGTVWMNLGDSYAGSGKGASSNKDGGQKEVYIPDPDSPQCAISKVPSGLKAKDMVGIPWMVAFALRSDGWYLRNDIIWVKPNPMPGSMKDRCTSSHEYIFLLSKEKKYYYDAEAIKEPTVTTSVKKFTDGGRDKQRGHRRQHAGFNGRYAEKLEKTGVIPALRNKRDVWRVSPSQYREAHFATFPEKLIEPCILAGCPPDGIVLDPFGGSGTTARVAIDHGRRAVLLDLNYKDELGSYLEMAKNRILAPKKEPKLKREPTVKIEYNLFKDSE